MKEAHRILKTNGTIYVFMGFRFISYLYDLLDRELKMFCNSRIVWHSTQGGKRRASPLVTMIFSRSRRQKILFLILTTFAYPQNSTVSVTTCGEQTQVTFGNFRTFAMAMKIDRITQLKNRKVWWSA